MNSYSHKFNENRSSLISSNFSTSTKYLFLDRDGVLIEDVHYISNAKDVSLCPNVSSFLLEAKRLNYCICIVTNQSSVARNMINLKKYLDITFAFLSFIDDFLWPDLILASFYHPRFSSSEIYSNWRKPNTGMFEYVVTHFNCNITNSIMVGDKYSDLLGAYSAGISKLCHVSSPSHPNEATKIKSWASNNNLPYISSKNLDPFFLY